jgi:hypothetical protein
LTCRWLIVIVWLAAAVAPASIGAQSLPARKPTTERPVPFAVGETLEYDVSWSSFLTAGSATLKVQEKKPAYGSRAYYIYGEGRPVSLIARLYPVYYKVDTLLDVFTLLPQRGSIYSDENGQRRTQVALFDRRAGTVTYGLRPGTVASTTVAVPPLTQDALSAIYALRAMPLLEGARIAMPVFDRGVLHAVRITVGAKERVKTAAGVFRAWRIAPVVTNTEGRQGYSGLVIWISDDARRLPVRLEAELAVGRFVLALRAVRP